MPPPLVSIIPSSNSIQPGCSFQSSSPPYNIGNLVSQPLSCYPLQTDTFSFPPQPQQSAGHRDNVIDLTCSNMNPTLISSNILPRNEKPTSEIIDLTQDSD